MRVYHMAFRNTLGKTIGPLSHFPSWFLIIGYPLFWINLYSFNSKDGITPPLAWIIFGAVAAASLWARPPAWNKFNISDDKLYWYLGAFLGAAICVIVVLAAFKPIHLMQEFDCLQYHYTLPRQHLIRGSFAHIPWSAADLFLLPVQFALSPFWFATVYPNKLPQLFFFLGIILILYRLMNQLAWPDKPWAGGLAVFAFLGSHGFGVQMGTGMLDLVLVYLFLACLDSLYHGRWFFAAVEAAFLVWSKPFMPIQVIAIIITMGAVIAGLKYFKWQLLADIPLRCSKQFIYSFLGLSIFVAAPFLFKSIYYTASPLYPFFPGLMGDFAHLKINPLVWQSVLGASDLWMNAVKDGYGLGRQWLEFIKHFWLLAVPDKGVNNAFDYPLGLPYLLFIGPFIGSLILGFRYKRISALSIFVIAAWGLWWFGSQQTRFLYVPIVLIFMITILSWKSVPRWLVICLTAALGLQLISIWGAHKNDIFRSSYAVLREEDKQLLMLKEGEWPTHDASYAQFPVKVTKEKLPFSILFNI